MTAIVVAALCISVITITATPVSRATQETTYWPDATWRTSSPEAQGIDSAVLADALEYVRGQRTRIHSLTVVRNGYVVLDTTFFPFQSSYRIATFLLRLRSTRPKGVQRPRCRLRRAAGADARLIDPNESRSSFLSALSP
jgi:hypothetical protein